MTVTVCSAAAASPKEADTAAATYASALSDYSHRLSNALDTWKPVRTPEGELRTWPSLRAQLAEPPVLEPLEGGAQASKAYAAATEIADRFDAIHAELLALESANHELNDRRATVYKMWGEYNGKLLQNSKG